MRNRGKIARVLGWASFVCAIASFTLWPYFQGIMFYSRVETTGVFLLALGALFMQPFQLVWQLTVIAVFCRLLDEFFFDPFKQGWNDWFIFFLLAVGITTHNSINKWFGQ